MFDILIFAGTTEGRKLAELCIKKHISAYVSVTTDYGAELLTHSDYIRILTGRMDCGQMIEFITNYSIKTVFDCTHPYAREASINISDSCKRTDTALYRTVRSDSREITDALYFDDIETAVKYLNDTKGNILITTGSKQIELFCRITDYPQRCTVRVLNTEKIIDECVRLGFDREKIIAQKPPYSEKQNTEHIQKCSAAYFITKDSGTTGGFEEKVSAARKCGARLLIIRRPSETGITLKDAEKILTERYYG